VILTHSAIVEVTAQRLAGQWVVAGNTAKSGTDGDRLIPYRRQAGDVLGLLRQLGVYNPDRVLQATPDAMLVAVPDEETAPAPWVQVTVRWGDVSCSQVADPVTFAILDCRRYLLEKVTRLVVDHRVARGVPVPDGLA
jgi:hypothetical protein